MTVIEAQPSNAECRCPHCGSANIELQATGRKTGVVVGGTAGAVATFGTETGMLLGRLVIQALSNNPALLGLGNVAGAVAGLYLGAKLGHTIGEGIDARILRLRRCHTCGAEFKA